MIEPYILYVEPNQVFDLPPTGDEWQIDKIVADSVQKVFESFSEAGRIWPTTWHRRIAAGETAVVARKFDDAGGFTWADTVNCRGPGPVQLFRLTREEACLHDIVVSSEYRGAGLAIVLKNAINKELADQGRVTLYSIVALFNTPSRKVKTKVNAEQLELRCFVRIGKTWWRDFRVRSYRSDLRTKRIVASSDNASE